MERKYLKVLKTPLETTGTLEYDAPDRLVKRTLEPKPETMTVAGERLVIESPARSRSRTLRLGDYPVLGAFVESLRATLNGDLAALERFYRVTLEGGPQRWQLTLTPRDPKMSALIESILIAGGRGAGRPSRSPGDAGRSLGDDGARGRAMTARRIAVVAFCQLAFAAARGCAAAPATRRT